MVAAETRAATARGGIVKDHGREIGRMEPHTNSCLQPMLLPQTNSRPQPLLPSRTNSCRKKPSPQNGHTEQGRDLSIADEGGHTEQGRDLSIVDERVPEVI